MASSRELLASFLKKHLESNRGDRYAVLVKPHYRDAISAYIRSQAKPPDKFSHQPRLYQLSTRLAEGEPYDDDVVFAAAWTHDLGVFIGHRPENAAELATWDHLAYAMDKTPEILKQAGFPEEKIPCVVEAIRTHMPASEPTSFEGTLLRDADILEQLGAIGILRIVSKVGRDTRFIHFGEALRSLRKNVEELPEKLRLASARREAKLRIAVLQDFVKAAEQESGGIGWSPTESSASLL